MHAYIHIHIYTYTLIHMYTYTHIHIYAYTHVHISTYTHLHMQQLYVWLYIYIHTQHTHTVCRAHTHNGQSYPHHAWFESFQLWPGGWQLENDPTLPLLRWSLKHVIVSLQNHGFWGMFFFFSGEGTRSY